MEGIGLDIDNPHELDLLLAQAGETNAQRLLRSWSFSKQSFGPESQSESAPAIP
jgi:hypothetical protein